MKFVPVLAARFLGASKKEITFGFEKTEPGETIEVLAFGGATRRGAMGIRVVTRGLFFFGSASVIKTVPPFARNCRHAFIGIFTTGFIETFLIEFIEILARLFTTYRKSGTYH